MSGNRKVLVNCVACVLATASLMFASSCSVAAKGGSGSGTAASSKTGGRTASQAVDSVGAASWKGKVKYIAHRGWDCEAPENTLPAYDLAGKLGFWGGETDIQVTSDGTWVVMHDETVDRMTNGKGSIAAISFADIRKLVIDAGANVSNYPGLQVPTFEEYLATCKKAGIVPVTEIKTATYVKKNYTELLEIIRKYGMENKMVIISFDYDALKNVHKLSPNMVLGILGDMTDTNIAIAKKYGAAFVDSDYTKVTKKQIDNCHAAGVPAAVWTIKDAAAAKTMIDYGADAITCENIKPNGQ